MTTNAWLAQATQKLLDAEIGTARLDSLVLLEDVTGINRAQLLALPDHKLSSAEQVELKKLLNRRATHQPLAYVRGFTEFYGRKFVVNPNVLEPRPESEAMIDLLKGLEKAGKLPVQPKIADVGAGSGALGITAALELKNTAITLLEIDKKALKVARTNVDKYTMDISCTRSDLLTDVTDNFDVLLCNLPYVPDEHTINQAALQEPSIAIFGGPDGLDLYRKLFKQVQKQPKQPLYILTEALPPQHTDLTQIAQTNGYHLQQTEDFIQLFGRVAV